MENDELIIQYLFNVIKEEYNFYKIQKQVYLEFNKYFSKSQLLQIYLKCLSQNKIQENLQIEKLLRIKSSRSNSGELEVSTMLPPDDFSCNYDCAMCPDERKINGASIDMSRSYLSSEGTPKLGLLENFDPKFQTWRRCIQYEYLMGHKIDKMIHILLGGTFHSYKKNIRDEYMHELFFACNIYNEYLSLRNNGIYKQEILKWLESNPFENKISFRNTIGSKLLFRDKKNFQQEKKINSLLKCGRITGIVIETRPDQICKKTIKELRFYGVTRVQIGVQHTHENVLKIMNRRHGVSASIKSLKMLKDAGFKIDIHVLFDCPGTTLEKDYDCALKIFKNKDFQPDYVKLYICVDVPFTKNRLYKQNIYNFDNNIKKDIKICMENGDWNSLKKIGNELKLKNWQDCYVWEPFAEFDYDNFKKMLIKTIQLIPEYVRLNRFHRDFPRAETAPLRLGYESNTLKTNLQQICMEDLEKDGIYSKDIRSRELRNNNVNLSNCKLFIHKYESNDGLDYFISLEEIIPLRNKTCIIGMIRCRITNWDLNKDENHKYYAPSWFLNVFHKKTLRVRELHVYGNLQSKNNESHGQHMGIGKFLLSIAESIAIILNLEQVVIISGVGVQKYYENQGYSLSKEDEYEIKDISNKKLPLFLFFQKNLWISTNVIKKNVYNHLSTYNSDDHYIKNILSFNVYYNLIEYFVLLFYFFIKKIY